VINNTEVLHARLLGTRTKTKSKSEGLFIKQNPTSPTWKILSKTKGKIEQGETVLLHPLEGQSPFELRFCEKNSDGSWVVQPLTNDDLLTALKTVGRVPIPPYIRKGHAVAADKEDYQTVYAAVPGAVAAPTAGLHFTSELLDRIRQAGTAVVSVTLHVGIGTFKPMTAERIEEHQMHAEWASLSPDAAETIKQRRKNGGRIVAAGTTSVRVLESSPDLLPFQGETSLFIKPPYSFSNTDVLLTNFHFPKSTLLILVRTFGGDKLVRRAYQEAIEERYRFFSYGDAMLIL
jgi:S-adenosylmethionine:tRNA ribosyltransferase-isomerase